VTERVFSLTEAEQRRVERVDLLVARAGVAELIATLADPSWTVRRAVVSALASLGDDAVGPLAAWLRDKRTSEHAIAAAVEALASSVGQSATAAAVAMLADRVPAVAADGAGILGRRQAVEATGALIDALVHADDNVAVAAIEALGALGGTRAVDALIAVLERRSFFRTFPALQVLARTADPRVVAPLAALLDDETYRIEAARALGRTGYAQAIRPLASLLGYGGDAVIRLVALALHDLQARAEWHGSGEHATATLRAVLAPAHARFAAALRRADGAERIAIAGVLGRIGDASVVPELAQLLDDAEARTAATDAIQRIGRAHDDAVIAALSRGDAGTRAALLPVVGSQRAATAVRALLDDEDPEVRARACEALARIGDTSAVPALFAALADVSPRVAHAAISGIHCRADDRDPEDRQRERAPPRPAHPRVHGVPRGVRRDHRGDRGSRCADRRARGRRARAGRRSSRRCRARRARERSTRWRARGRHAHARPPPR